MDTSSTRRKEPDEGLLIDLTDDGANSSSNARGMRHSKSQPDNMSLIDVAISSKYGYLPPPLCEQQKQPDDPFEVGRHVKSMLGMPLTDDNTTSRKQPYSAQTVGSSSVDKNKPFEYTASEPIPVYSKASTRRQPSTVERQYSQPERTEKSDLSVPPLPPRLYSNVPGSSPARTPSPVSVNLSSSFGKNKPLPPLPSETSVSPKSRYYCQPPLEDTATELGVMEKDSTVIGQSRFYDIVPNEDNYNSSSSTTYQKTFSKDLKQWEQANTPVVKAANAATVSKAFDWVSGAVADLSIANAKDNKDDHNKKSSSSLMDHMTRYASSGPRYDRVCEEETSGEKNSKGDRRYQLDSAYNREYEGHGAKPKIPLPKAAENPDESLMWSSDEWDSDGHEESPPLEAPPDLPPRDFETTQSQVTRKPDIRPIVQNGVQLSTTHYFLLVEKNKRLKENMAAKTAEVKPFSVSSGNTTYQNISSISQSGVQKLATSPTSRSVTGSDRTPRSSGSGLATSPPRHHVNSSTSSISNSSSGESKLSWSGMTGLRPVGSQPQTATTRHEASSWRHQASNPTPAVSVGHLQDKINALERQVHGVTSEECQAALTTNNWDVDRSTKYLKLEQLFRLGLANRQKCQKLLETFNWNLEMAGSVLLDELQTGSAV